MESRYGRRAKSMTRRASRAASPAFPAFPALPSRLRFPASSSEMRHIWASRERVSNHPRWNQSRRTRRLMRLRRRLRTRRRSRLLTQIAAAGFPSRSGRGTSTRGLRRRTFAASTLRGLRRRTFASSTSRGRRALAALVVLARRPRVGGEDDARLGIYTLVRGGGILRRFTVASRRRANSEMGRHHRRDEESASGAREGAIRGGGETAPRVASPDDGVIARKCVMKTSRVSRVKRRRRARASIGRVRPHHPHKR